MKKFYFLSLMALAMVFSGSRAKAQTTFTKQVIIVNGGDFGNPDDYVSVASYDPATGETTEFATIYTQSVQDVIIVNGFAYVAAQDSIVKLNIESYEKVAAVAASGVNQLASDGNVLVASFWFPVTENFVKTFSLDDLSLITAFAEITGEASDIMIKDGIALVAIPGGWGSTTGKIAAIDLSENSVINEDDFGEFYAGIGFFASWNEVTTAFMRTPWDGSETKLATFDAAGEVIEEFTIENASLSNPTGQLQNLLYAVVNNGIGVFDLETSELINAAVVAPQEMSVAASAFDTVNNLFYLTTTDFSSTGSGFIYKLDGEITGSFEAGISAQAIAIDYRDNTSIFERNIAENLDVYPNPVTNLIRFNIPSQEKIKGIFILDISGRVVAHRQDVPQMDVSDLTPGLYFVTLKTDVGLRTGKFIKQ